VGEKAFLASVPMRPSTRSRSGVAMDASKGVLRVGSKLAAAGIEQKSGLAVNAVAGPGRFHQKLLAPVSVSAKGKGQRDFCVEMEVNSSGSSPVHSDFHLEEEGQLDDRPDLHSSQLEVADGLMADQLFEKMPQSHPVVAGAMQSGDSSARTSEKAGGSVLKAPGTGGVPKAPWVNLFKENRNLGGGIELDKVGDEGDLVHIEDDDVDEVDRAWGLCLVGLFAGKFPGMGAVRSLREGWNVQCTHWIHRSGWIVFKFQSEEDRVKVLNGGPYFAYGRNLMLKIMPRCFRFGGEDSATVPVWIQLPDLPLDCWNARALSKIVSKVGKPITTDKMTRTKERISFARVLVEVDVSKELVTGVEVRLPTGVVYDQLVVFEFTPKYCKKCMTFSHGEEGCNKVSAGRTCPVYVPKRRNRPGGVDMPTAQPCNSGLGQSGGSRLAHLGSALLDGLVVVPEVGKSVEANPVASPLCPTGVLDATAVGVAGTANAGMQKLLSGQQGAATAPQQSVVVDTRLEDECPAVDPVTGDRGGTSAGKKRKQKKKSGQSGVTAVLHQSDGEGLQVEATDCVPRTWAEVCERSLAPLARSASVSKGKVKGKALQSSN